MIRSIFGMRGHGKTTLAAKMIVHRERPAIVVDLFEQFSGFGGERFTRARSLLNRLIETGGAKRSAPLFISCFEPEEFNIVCKTVIEHGNLLFVVDEVDMFDAPNHVDRDFRKVIHYGRHYKIDLITTSRRPHNVSRDLTSQSELFYIFRVIEDRDLKYFENLSGSLPSEIQRLKKFEYLEFDLLSIKKKLLRR